jgi:MFS family permease
MFDAYRQALRAPGAKAFYLAAAPARVGIAMTVLGMVWLVHGATGSYAQAGLATGAFALTEAVIGPQSARLIDAFGQTRVVPLLLAAHAVCVAGLIAGGPAILLAGLAGATIPQVGALAAARWSHVLSGPLLGTGFALEAIANGVAFLAGPAIVGVVAATVDPRAGAALAAALVIGGGLALCAQRGSAPPPVRRGEPGSLRNPKHSRLASPEVAPPRALARGLAAARHAGPPVGVGRVVAANVCLGMVFGALQVSVTAFAVERDAAAFAGPLYAITSAASLLSGFVYGRRSRTLRLRTAFLGLSLGCVPLLLVDTPEQLAFALIAPGLAIAPILTLSSVITQSRVGREVLTQAFTWLNSAAVAGVAVAATISGQLVDARGPDSAFALAVLAAVLGATAWCRGVR